MRYWTPYLRAPAGAAAGVVGTQGNPQPIAGFPAGGLPGYANALDAYYHQQQVGGYFPQLPQVSQQFACESEYLSRLLCACLIDGLLNIQQTARLPSHVSIPYSGIPFKRHAGTGRVGITPDPPISLPPVGGAGPYTVVVPFTVPTGSNGVITSAGFTVDPETARDLIDFRIQVNGQVVSPFDRPNGVAAAAADGTSWLGYPFTILSPDTDLTINLFAGDVATLEARNSFGAAAVTVAGMMAGWTYRPTIQTSDRTIRGTLTDQR